MRRRVLNRCATVLIVLLAISFPAGRSVIGSAWAAAASPQRPTISEKESSAKDGGVSTLSCGPQDVAVSIPDGIVTGAGQSVAVPILLSDVTGKGVISGDVVVTFNAAVVQATGVGAGTLTGGPGCVVTPNLSTPGQATISAFCTGDLAGAGSLAVITFQAVGATGSSTSLHIASAQLNEGNPADCDDDGSLSICGADNDCDGVDDDCDGTPDDNYVPTATTCGSGACQASGTRTCVAGVEQDSCVTPVTMSIPDGVVGSPAQTIAVPILLSDVTGKGVLAADVVVSFNPAVVQATSVVAGTLTSGGGCIITPNLTLPGQATVSVFCSNEMTGSGSLVSINFLMLGAAGTSTPVHIVTAQLNEGVPGVCPDDGSISICGVDNDCDGVDDDCDGTADDNYVPTGTTCGVGACSGNTGQLTCQAGSTVNTCNPTGGATPDTDCDAVDDDCDGTADDNYVPTGTTCGVGACTGNTGQLICQAGSTVNTCNPTTGATPDTDCDAVDDDCDGTADDNYVPTGTTCGVGACTGNTGQLVCQAGSTVDTCNPTSGATPDTDCDAVDDDCDGTADDNYVPTGTTCGVGACTGNTGQLVCQAGSTVNTCNPTTGATPDTDCDAVDDDCDGTADDNYVPTGTTCGVGACTGNTGQLVCQAGSTVNTCNPATGATPDTDCDAIDDDCDGTADDNYVPTGTTCGVGACTGNTGQLVCQAGSTVNTCNPATGATPDTDCDAIDDDCDGTADDNYVPTGTTCGVGACTGNTGQLVCQAGSTVNTCNPTTGATPDTDCDAIDDDCDGTADDNYVPTGTTCGVGACTGNTGQLVCQAGSTVNTCNPTTGATPDTDCDAIDDDCDGTADDNYVPTGTTCGVGACTGNTGQLVCQAGSTVNTCNPTTGATPDTDCDAVDDDCDGTADDNYVPTGTTCGVGACTGNTGQLVCQAGSTVNTCNPTGGSTPDTDCDSVDDDCDGTADDNYAPTGTTCGVGACTGNTGQLICQAGSTVNTCNPTSGATPDADCDAVDDDCDGTADDNYAPTGTTCGVGACTGNSGQLECQAGATVDTCNPTAGATPDTDCDGTDDDCDGTADDNYAPTGTTCGVGACTGNTGQLECQAGATVDTCNPTAGATPDTDCDGTDDDCDGTTDEGFVPTPTTCGSGACTSAGTTTCVGGVLGDSCVADDATISIPTSLTAIPGSTALVPVNVTNVTGLGVVSADITVSYNAAVVQALSVSAGSLTAGCTVLGNTSLPGQVLISVFCTGPVSGSGSLAQISFLVVGAYGASTPLGLPVATLNEGDPSSCTVDGSLAICGSEFCDGLDNDCDGQTDESDPLAGQACSTGLPGICSAGAYVCGAGVLSCQGTVGPVTEVCDGLDDDCDGLTDEGLGSSTCGVGVCTVTVNNCVAGVPQSCTPGTPLHPTDVTCDGVDDDCDGTVDDNYVPTGTTCGVGACSGNSGQLICQAGSTVNTCNPTGGATPDNNCDAIDDDCDGTADDNYVPTGTTCGVGACTGNTGQLICQAGSTVNTCNPAGGATPDNDCDAIDDDCDGTADDNYVPTGTTCGVGACTGNTGQLVCQAGSTVNTCNPTGGATPDTDCDAVDDDCDGTADDNYVPTGTTCGVGACTGNTGQLICQAGSTVNTCNPTGGATPDTDCDGADDDCDGAADDNYVPTGTTCGVGACSGNSGQLICQAGSTVNTCNPTTGATPDTDCDAIDDDCDGSADEGYVPVPTTCGSGVCANSGTTTCIAGVVGDTCVPDATTISIPSSLTAIPTATIMVPVQVTSLTGLGVVSADLRVSYSPLVLQPLSVSAGSLTGGCSVLGNTSLPGQVLISVFCTAPLSGAGSLAIVSFQVVGGYGATTPLGLPTATLNEGVPTSCPIDGSLSVCGSEFCDGLDNDCDGQTDESDPQLGQSCTTGQPGVCGGGTTVCSSAQLTCQQSTLPSPEVCDGLDNNCDTQTDENLGTITCGLGICERTVQACVTGTPGTCVPGTPVTEACNALDDDCDGLVDDGFNVGAACTMMPGSCPPPAHVVCTADGTSSVCLNDPLLGVAHAVPSTTALVSWLPIPGAVIYDVIRIDLDTLRGTLGNYALATELCLANDIAATSLNDPDVPLSTEGFGYLMRAAECTGGASYESGAFSQVGLRDPEIALSGLQCP